MSMRARVPIPGGKNVVHYRYADHLHRTSEIGKCVQGRCFLHTCVEQIGPLSNRLLLLVDLRVSQTAYFSPGSNGNSLVEMCGGQSMPITSRVLEVACDGDAR